MFRMKTIHWMLAAAVVASGSAAFAAAPSDYQLTLSNTVPLLDDADAPAATNPVVPQQEAAPHALHLYADVGYVSDYWFRYRNRSPDVFNLQDNVVVTLDLNALGLQSGGNVYAALFTDISPGTRKRYKNHYRELASRFATTLTNAPIPSGGLEETDLTIGYHNKFADLVGVDVGWTAFITPTSLATITPSGNVTETGHGKSVAQEAFAKVQLDDGKFLGAFALNPYVFIGLDYTSSYEHGAGQYFEVGVSHTYNIPNTEGLSITPFANASFIHDEKLLDRDLVHSRDGYLGAQGGVQVKYALNNLLHIPADCGSYAVGGFISYVQAGDRYAEPTGSRRGDVVTGLSLSASF